MKKLITELSNDELIEYINDLERQLNNEKYGLYFDRKATPEEVVENCKKNIPILVHDKNKDILKEGQENLLIEGDNFAALSSLCLAYKNGVADIICIDPPYNTGVKDFAYNDRYVDQEDGYRHTKWLNFMEKRLNLAKQLLKDDGVIFINIDDNEQAQLKLLCNSIFGEENYVGEVMWISNPNGRGDDEYLGRIHEYVLVYRKTDQLVFQREKQDISQFNLRDEKGVYAEQILYSKLSYSKSMDYVITAPDGSKIYAGGDKEAYELRQRGRYTKKDYTWRWSEEKLQNALKTGDAIIKKVGGEWKVYRKRRPTDEGAPYKGFYNAEGTRHGTDQIKKVFNYQPFDHPKPTGLIKFLLSLKKNKDGQHNEVVFDFFAGSGTTAQAVLELNKEDGGHRKFILCTNNENNIMTDVCYPRIKTVITGIRPDGSKYSDGLPGTVRYYKVDFVKDNEDSYQAKYDLVEQCDGLLCILESIHEKYTSGECFNIYTNHSRDKGLCIFNDDYNKQYFQKMLAVLKKSNFKENIVYYFKQDNEQDSNIEQEVLDAIPNAVVKPIPSKIYDIYRHIKDELRRTY